MASEPAGKKKSVKSWRRLSTPLDADPGFDSGDERAGTTDESEYHGRYYDFPAVKCFPKPAQQPHPPVILGGSAKNVFKRTVEWGDGWMPVSTSPDEIRRGRETLNELAAQAGRDPQSISVLAFGQPGQLRSRDQAQALGEAGAEHAIIWLNKFQEAEVITELEGLAAEMLGA